MALYYAARNGYEDVVDLLCQHGGHEGLKPDIAAHDRAASMEAFSGGRENDLKGSRRSSNTILIWFSGATTAGRLPMCAVVEDWRIAAGQPGHVTKDVNGATPLHWAARNGHKDVAELLLASEADVDAGKTHADALHFAAEEGHKDVAELLVASKADVNAKNNIDVTPLLCRRRGPQGRAELLLASRADVGAKESSTAARLCTWRRLGATRTWPDYCADTTKCIRRRRPLRMKNQTQLWTRSATN